MSDASPAHVRWAVVGTGGIARRTVGDLRASGGAEVVAVASRSQASADAFAAEFGLAAAYGSFEELCAADGVDAVYIGTPHSTHFAYAKAALESGKHVLCEKPLTMTADEARELGAIAARHGRFLMEAMWMAFGPAVRRTRELIAEGVIGEPRFLQAGLGYPVPADGPPRFWDASLGGGALYDMGIYTVTLAQLLFGTPTAITVRGEMRADGVDLHETYQLDFASGASAQLVTSITFLVPPSGWIGGTQGSISLNEPLFSPRSIRVTTGKPPAPPVSETIEFPAEELGYVPMFREVNAAILAGDLEHPLHPISATVAALHTLERIRALLAEYRDAL
jgi:predicted dehydrogenase